MAIMPLRLPCPQRTNMKYLIIFIALFIAFQHLSAQNCGMVTNFSHHIQGNNNGTSTYTFQVTVQATSGGSKSVSLNIRCGTYYFVTNQCEASLATTRVINFGPYTVPTCTGEIQLVWSGHSNATCGGTTCNALQVFASLPVELTSFDIAKAADAAILSWETASEKNNEKFIVERSADGIKYEQIGEVSGNGTTNETKSYKHIDSNPSLGVNYYRLKQVDFDGKYEYSPISSVEIYPTSEIAVFPTIFSETLNITLPEQMVDEEINITIFNLQGAKVFNSNVQGNTMNKLTMPALQPGQYILHIGNGRFAKTALVSRS